MDATRLRRLAKSPVAVTLAAMLMGGITAQAQTPAAPAPAAPAGTPAAVAKAAIDVTDGWTRATPGQATSAAVYVRITNAGKDGDTLTGVESPNAAHAMIHTTTVANGTATMTATPQIALPARTVTTFGPNGRHIMLDGLKAPLHEGESFIITLVFAKAGKISATVKVLGVSATGPGGAH